MPNHETDPAFGLMLDFGKLTKHTTRHINQMRQDTLFSDGALPIRVKTLAALLWSVSARCEPCIQYYAQRAVEHGATESELGEILAVASTMGGCVGETWALKAFKAFRGVASGNTLTDTDTGSECCTITEST